MKRFTDAQLPVYDTVLSELRKGQKQSHWMWFIFPQIKGLGKSTTAKYYAINSLAEADRYLRHPLLGPRLIECTEAVLAIKGKSALEIFGHPDNLKLKSSMTLFAQVAGDESVFHKVLNRYFDGQADHKTLEIISVEDYFK